MQDKLLLMPVYEGGTWKVRTTYWISLHMCEICRVGLYIIRFFKIKKKLLIYFFSLVSTSYMWTGWVWEIIGWGLSFMNITHYKWTTWVWIRGLRLQEHYLLQMNRKSLRNNRLKFMTLGITNHFRGNSRDSIEGNATWVAILLGFASTSWMKSIFHPRCLCKSRNEWACSKQYLSWDSSTYSNLVG